MENDTLKRMLAFQELTLGTVDYCLFGSLMILSLVIGLYFGFFSKQNSTDEYLFGGKTMGYVPVAISMLAGHVSGITLLGVPTEVYKHGSTYFTVVFSIVFTCLITSYIFLPVFYKLQLPSIYEYLEIRFSRRIRTLASIFYVVSLMAYIPIVVYVPVLAFSQVTDISLYAVTPVLGLICIVYTSLGGIKAVIWTDTVQYAFTLGGLLAVFFIGVHAMEGFSNVWSIASQGNRTEIFNMDSSPYVRKTFWGMAISHTALLLTHLGISQNCVQRFLSISRQTDVRKALLLLAIGLITMKIICGFSGLVMYAWFRDCDPLEAKIVERSDQILPYFVMNVAGHVPGLPGIFLAGLVSCALSTMSSSLNTLAGTIYDDFIDQWLPESSNKDVRATTIMKVIAVIVGLISTAMVFLVQNLGTIFELSVSIRGVVEGPLFGLFVLGTIFPWVGQKGALTGSLVSLAFMMFLIIGNQWNIYTKKITYQGLPTSIEHCPSPYNQSDATKNAPSESAILLEPADEPFFLFRVSMLHFNMLGTVVNIIAAVIASFIEGEADTSKVNPDHITPVMRRFLPKKKYKGVAVEEICVDKLKNAEVRKDRQNTEYRKNKLNDLQ